MFVQLVLVSSFMWFCNGYHIKVFHSKLRRGTLLERAVAGPSGLLKESDLLGVKTRKQGTAVSGGRRAGRARPKPPKGAQ